MRYRLHLLLQGWFYRGITGISGILFYYNLASDIFTINVFVSKPDVYIWAWVIIASCLLCLPTALYTFNVLRNHLVASPMHAIKEALLALFQLTAGLQAYECVLCACETTAYLDYKYVQGVYKSMPQIILKTYIMFDVAVQIGAFDGWVLSSICTSLISITIIFIMLFDRKPARRLSMAAVSIPKKIFVQFNFLFLLFASIIVCKGVDAVIWFVTNDIICHNAFAVPLPLSNIFF